MSKDNPFGKQGWTPDRVGDLKGRTFVITGANVGAGFEAARVLLRKGGEVVMLNRNPAKSAAAIEQLRSEFGAETSVSFIEMDLAALSSVRSAAEDVLKQVPKIDALICNAAIAQVAKQEITVDGFESQLGVNHYGHFLLCGLLFERVESSAGRIVVVGSNGYKMGLGKIQFEDLNFDQKYSPMNAYCQSKLAQMMFAYELQRRVEKAGSTVEVQVCHPGAARTTLSKEEANTFTKVLFFLLSPLAQSAERGAWPEVLCATEPGLLPRALYGPTQRAEMVGAIGTCPLKDHVLDESAAERLWADAETKTGLSWSPQQA